MRFLLNNENFALDRTFVEFTYDNFNNLFSETFDKFQFVKHQQTKIPLNSFLCQ